MSETGSSTNISIKQRIVGALVLVSLAVIFIPMILDGEGPFDTASSKTFIPDEPSFKFKTFESNVNKTKVAQTVEPVSKSIQITDDAADYDITDGATNNIEGGRVSIVDSISEKNIAAAKVASAKATAAKKIGDAKSRIIDKNRTGDTSDDVMPAPVKAPDKQLVKLTAPSTTTATNATTSQHLSNPAAKIVQLKENKTRTVKGWSVQLGSFRTKPNALRLRDKLRVKGFASYVEAVTNRNGERYRVRVGPELRRVKAESLKKQLSNVVKLDGLIVSH